LGVLGALSGTMGNLAALLATRVIVGFGDDRAGRVHLFDGLSLVWRAIRIPPDPACKACG
jgi:adenylyltransferase/sulfurtransferase